MTSAYYGYSQVNLFAQKISTQTHGKAVSKGVRLRQRMYMAQAWLIIFIDNKNYFKPDIIAEVGKLELVGVDSCTDEHCHVVLCVCAQCTFSYKCEDMLNLRRHAQFALPQTLHFSKATSNKADTQQPLLASTSIASKRLQSGWDSSGESNSTSNPRRATAHSGRRTL